MLASALREAEEESGLTGFRALPLEGGPEILDVDVHEIPARKNEPAHLHYDVRFLLRAQTNAISISDESNDLRWCTPQEILGLSDEESLLRMLRKTAVLRGIAIAR